MLRVVLRWLILPATINLMAYLGIHMAYAAENGAVAINLYAFCTHSCGQKFSIKKFLDVEMTIVIETFSEHLSNGKDADLYGYCYFGYWVL